MSYQRIWSVVERLRWKNVLSLSMKDGWEKEETNQAMFDQNNMGITKKEVGYLFEAQPLSLLITFIMLTNNVYDIQHEKRKSY